MNETKKVFLEQATVEVVKPLAETTGNLTLPISKSVGQTLADLWDWAIGSRMSLLRDKQTFVQTKDLEEYKAKLQTEVESIPEENLITPPLYVVGPALDAWPYYMESKDLSDMFSNLISSAFDSTKIAEVHPSFTEIIKQMSPLDAMNIALFKNNEVLPICEYVLKFKENGSYRTLTRNIFLENEGIEVSLQSASISNLIRTGLIETPSGKTLSNKDLYKKFYETDLFKEQQEELQNAKSDGIADMDAEIEILKGIVILTPLGENFMNIVMK